MNKNIIINEMLINNVHIGHKKNLLHQDSKYFVLNINAKIHIINLELTFKFINKIKFMLNNIINYKKKLLIVCVEKKMKIIVEKFFENINMPYINKRWLGGSLTNFKTLKTTLDNMNYIKNILNNLKFKINKKKKRFLKKKLIKLESFLKGLSNLKNLPDYMFVINVKKHKIALSEAKKKNIPTIGIVDTNNSTKNIDYIIPGNDDSYKSILFYIKKIISFIRNND